MLREGSSNIPASCRSTGAPLEPYPKIVGFVVAVVPDGVGGWFIGGSFERVGDFSRHNLAHILPDGSVAPWDPAPPGPGVECLALSGNTLYVGGAFTRIGGQSRNLLAAVDGTETQSQMSAEIQARLASFCLIERRAWPNGRRPGPPRA